MDSTRWIQNSTNYWVKCATNSLLGLIIIFNSHLNITYIRIQKIANLHWTGTLERQFNFKLASQNALNKMSYTLRHMSLMSIFYFCTTIPTHELWKKSEWTLSMGYLLKLSYFHNYRSFYSGHSDSLRENWRASKLSYKHVEQFMNNKSVKNLGSPTN